MERNILSYIGNTPLIRIEHLNENPAVAVYAKIEYVNPGGSIKDRPALYMIEQAEAEGLLTPDKIVIEATSGNTGIGLALVCAVKGYRLLLTMSESASEERRKILRARGAEIRLTPGHLGTDGAIEEAYRLAREHPDTYVLCDQFNNPANWMAHYETTGREIWEQTEGKLTHLVATMGTTGTLMGVSRRLKEHNPDVEIIGVEPYLGHKIQGLKNLKEAYVPEIFEKSRLDVKVNVEDEEAYEMARRLASEEGLFVGMSSGAAMAVALKKAQELKSGLVVAILPDGGERYLSTTLFTVKEKVELRLFNTLSRKKEPLAPIRPGKVGMYSCGPSAYRRPNLSECRRYVFADLVRRYLGFRDLAVEQVIGVSDLDDNVIEGSEKAGKTPAEFAEKNIADFLSDLEVLGVAQPDRLPRTSEHLGEMTDLAGRLAEKGFAYEKLRSLYFNIGRVPGYGDLSHVDVNKIRLGATVDLDEYEKDNPRDFTLFKRSRLSELKRGIAPKTPWGNARPSLHMQCAAMSRKYLGENYDILVGSRDFLFPHHENESAIAQALTGKPAARAFLHCEAVYVDGKKVGAAGPALTVPDLLARGFTGPEIRCFLLSTHYRKPLSLNDEGLENARKALGRLARFTEALKGPAASEPHPDSDQLAYDLKAGFVSALDDDFALPSAMAAVFAVIKRANVLLGRGLMDRAGRNKIAAQLAKLNEVLNLLPGSPEEADPEISALIAQRDQARKEKNFALADEIRDKLAAVGVTVRDEKIIKK